MKNRIIEGADNLFMRYGIKTMTMDDIAKHLSVSKKTIYQHFKDKNELVIRVIESHMDAENGIINDIQKSASSAVDEMFLISKYLKSMMTVMNPSVLLDLQKYYPEAWAYFQNHKQECINDTILKNLEWGMEEGLYRADINPNILAISRVEQIEMAFNPMIFPTSKFSVLEVNLALLTHFIMGVVTAKGLEQYNEYLKK